MSTGQYAFVACEPGSRPDPAVASQVRSHSMKGRNVRIDSRRSKRRAKRAALEASKDAPEATANSGLVTDLCHAAIPYFLQCRDLAPQPLPLLIQLDPERVQLARTVRKSLKEMLQQITTFIQVSDSTFSPGPFVDFKAEDYLKGSSIDECLLRSMLFVNSAFLDMAHQRPLRKSTYEYLVETLRSVNQKIVDQDSYMNASVLYIIQYLAFAAAGFGDRTALQSHMAGLKKIIELRGGVQGLLRVQFKLERLDLLWALKFGGTPYFLPEPQLSALPPAHPTRHEAQYWFSNCIDPRLRVAFDQLRQLTILANKQSELQTKLSMQEFQTVISPIQLRLLSLEPILSNPLDEGLRLGMLVFIAGLFRIPHSQPTWSCLGGKVRTATDRMRLCDDISSSDITTWLLMLSSITCVDPKEPWLREAWAESVGISTTWEKVHKYLQQVLWIKSMHERLAMAAFEALTK